MKKNFNGIICEQCDTGRRGKLLKYYSMTSKQEATTNLTRGKR